MDHRSSTTLVVRRDGHVDVPDVHVDFAPDDDAVPCSRCDRWRHEVVVDTAGELVLREWHAGTCPEADYWIG